MIHRGLEVSRASGLVAKKSFVSRVAVRDMRKGRGPPTGISAPGASSATMVLC